jgi:hypothetical protein
MLNLIINLRGKNLHQKSVLFATTTRSVLHWRGSWIVFLVTIIIGISAAFFLYSLDRFSLIYYGDSVSHLVRAREFVDSNNPGLFEQVGTAWLPLPHLLLLPFTLIDILFKTGFAGLAVSLPCLAFSAVFLYKIIKRHLDLPYIAIAGALLYATNPNILYMGITPMTEAPFLLFFIGAAYFFMRWMSGPRKYLSLNPKNEGKILGIATIPGIGSSSGGGGGVRSYRQSSHIFLDLAMCSIFISLATLCRYEGWVLPLIFVAFVIITEIRKRDYNHSRKYKCGIILVSFLSFSGIALWVIWNAYEYNDPLEFANAPYFSAASQARERPELRSSLYLQPWNVASLYGLTAFAIFGPVLLATAVLGYLFHRYLGSREERRKRRNLYLFLAMPPIFTVLSLLIGVGEMNQRQWFNSRYAILLAPFIISLTCVFLARLPHRFKKNHYLFAATVFIFFVYQFLTPALGVVTFLNATSNLAGNRPFQIQTAEALSSSYDGNSTILIITGSQQHNKIMHASGIPLKQFDQILERQSYKDSFKEPWLHAKYFILGKKPDNSAGNVAQYWLDRQSLLEKYFDTIYQDKYYKLMAIIDRSGSPNRSDASNQGPNSGSSSFSIAPETESSLLMHNHIHLNITADGNPMVIPANIGIDPQLHEDNSLDMYGPQKSPLHTHTSSGTLHVESKIITDYTLGEFLDVWGLPLGGKAIKMTVDGNPVSDYRNHILRDGQEIHLILCSNVRSLYPDRC